VAAAAVRSSQVVTFSKLGSKIRKILLSPGGVVTIVSTYTPSRSRLDIGSGIEAPGTRNVIAVGSRSFEDDSDSDVGLDGDDRRPVYTTSDGRQYSVAKRASMFDKMTTKVGLGGGSGYVVNAGRDKVKNRSVEFVAVTTALTRGIQRRYFWTKNHARLGFLR
jgi:hypothetical protein